MPDFFFKKLPFLEGAKIAVRLAVKAWLAGLERDSTGVKAPSLLAADPRFHLELSIWSLSTTRCSTKKNKNRAKNGLVWSCLDSAYVIPSGDLLSLS